MLDRSATLGSLLVLVAAWTSCLLLVADVCVNAEVRGWLHLQSAGHYLVALAPVAFALALGPSCQNMFQVASVNAFVLVSMGQAVPLLIATPLAAGSAPLFAASGLSICASLLLMIAFGSPRLSRLLARRRT